MSAQVALALRDAADVLERDGWRQESYGSTTGCKCVWGAIHYAASLGQAVDEEQLDYTERQRAESAAREVAHLIGVDAFSGLVEWNDAPGRTAAEVIAALRSAADRAEAEQ